ncbi:alpha-D-ribose 1-methylphosphonate 5-triphosphate diphosphatase [Marinivivus vitaminiproducens]|uniref:alpha-D-ribose 1-methylphosphonate 5-triphosphate diphosphatase n=1 Tax=Marinivivus vitaminiproducens TaxID=3035935 RepID=UPI00279EDAFF|nr:alpha-D-ribose 1-methylphosphonate 5-triphosphate diphosphatase [Geminicoccaceae bacterium SCSIO 64248]
MIETPEDGAREIVLANAEVVTPEEVVRGRVVVVRGRIVAVEEGSGGGHLDLNGDLLIPGLIDLHTDSLEKHIQPRSGVQWDPVAAALSHDLQIAGSGITTVFDSLTVGAAETWDSRDDLLEPMIDGLLRTTRHGMLRAEHFVHLRCEVTHPDIVALVERLIEGELVRFLSVMDHAPGDRQVPDVEVYRRLIAPRMKNNDRAMSAHVDQLIRASRTIGPANRRAVAALANARGLPLASHDDARPAHIEEAAALGVQVTEFPTTVEAAAAARTSGLKILMGAPNLLRGTSHSGNVAAGTLAERGLVDIFASDYVPASMLHAAFALSRPPFDLPLPQAIACVTEQPAAAAGLTDRGVIAPGKRADLVHVRMVEGWPVVRAVWREGSRIV